MEKVWGVNESNNNWKSKEKRIDWQGSLINFPTFKVAKTHLALCLLPLPASWLFLEKILDILMCCYTGHQGFFPGSHITDYKDPDSTSWKQSWLIGSQTLNLLTRSHVRYHLSYIPGNIDKFCLQVHNFGNNEDKQMILTPNERSFYLAPDDISFFNIITIPFHTEPPPTDDLLDAVSKEVRSLVSAPRKNSILHIFVSLVTVPLEAILQFWKKEEIAWGKIWAIRRVQ